MTRYALSAVVLAAAAMEAGINEIYVTAVDEARDTTSSATVDCAQALSERWKDASKKPILQKHQVALEVCGKERFDEKSEPYQAARHLTQLRNALMHYKSEWDSDDGDHRKLEQNLRNRFPEAKLWAPMSSKRAWLPYGCLGAGCANWACSTARTMHEAFCARLGITSVLG